MAIRDTHGTTHPFHASADIANQPQLSLCLPPAPTQGGYAQS